MSFLPGMFPVIAAAAAVAPLTTLSQVLSATSSASTITAPAGIQAGDLILFMDHGENLAPGAPAAVAPNDFTAITDSITDPFGRTTLYYKIANGTEGSSSLTGMSGTDYQQKLICVFRGDVPIKAVTIQNLQSTVTDNNPSSIAITSGSGAVPMIVVGCYFVYNTGAVNPRTFSPAKDGEVANSDDMYIAWKFYDVGETPANVTIDMDDEGFENILIGLYIECS